MVDRGNAAKQFFSNRKGAAVTGQQHRDRDAGDDAESQPQTDHIERQGDVLHLIGRNEPLYVGLCQQREKAQ